MRRRLLPLACALALVLPQSGCYGKFELVRKVHEVNGKITDEKIVHSAVCWLFLWLPVYAFAGLGDFLIFNVIEFYSGSNPLVAAREVEGPGGAKFAAVPRVEDGVSVLEITETRDGAVVRRIVLRRDAQGEVAAAPEVAEAQN